MNARTETPRPSAPFWRKLLLRLALAFGVLLLIALALSLWLLRTESGLRFVLARAVGATEGKLSVERASGRLAGPVELSGVRYHDPAAGADVRVGNATVDFRFLELMAWRLHVTQLTLADLDVALTTVPKQPEPEPPAGEFSLAAPIDIVLDRLALERARVASDGQPLVAIDRLDVAGRWTRDGVAVNSLALRSPDGSVDLDGTVAALPGYPGNGTLRFAWTIDGIAIAGDVTARSSGRDAKIALALASPTQARLDAELVQADDLPWTARLSVPAFDPRTIRADAGLESLALSLDGKGTLGGGELTGEAGINGHAVRLDPLRYALADEVLRIEALHLSTPEAQGALDATGEIRLGAEPVSATLALDWKDVELPADLVGQALATHGHLDANGSAERFHAEGAFALGPPGRLTDATLKLDGTPDAIELETLALHQRDGDLDANGTITLQPRIEWDIRADAKRFDPSAFAQEWPGAIDFSLASQGALTDGGPSASVRLERLGGTLRQRALSGNADLRLAPGYSIEGPLRLAAGRSRIEVDGHGGSGTDADIRLAIASLADWLPDATGSLNGAFRVRGDWPKLAVRGNAKGSTLAFGDTRLASLDLDADIADVSAPQGTIDLHAGKLDAGGLAFDSIALTGGGDRAAHRIALDAKGTPLALRLAGSGGERGNGEWAGSLATLDVDIENAPPLRLENAAALAWDGKRLRVGETCLVGDGPRLCVNLDAAGDGALDAGYRIERLPLALLANLASPELGIEADGELGGNGEIHRAADGALHGTAALSSAEGGVATAEQPDKPLLRYTGLALDATLSPQATRATLRAALDHDGRIDGEVTLTGATGSAQALSGRVDATINSLAFVELLTAEVANVEGRVAAHLALGGTTAAPEVQGTATLSGFASEIPAAGLKLTDGEVVVTAADLEHFTLDGRLRSGDGTLQLAGTGDGNTLHATIRGENFLAADIPAAMVLISPDLAIDRDEKRIAVSGSVTIPKTNVNLAKLPGGGVSQRSPDVVIADAENVPEGGTLPIAADVAVILGDEVKLAGHGIDGRIRGRLRIDQQPGKVAKGTGTLTVDGTYKAYGQDLAIESGRLLFAGTALDNPGLDIRAARKILGASGGDMMGDSITAGLQVRGTALVPVLTVFSVPTMEQSEALSYLITGKPLSGLKSGEGDMLGAAAQALGSATGDLLAKGIGARTGLDAGVSDNAAVGGAAFTVGKYLSPRLYLSYGVGLFTPGEVVSLKYLLSRRWNFEAQNATTGNRAGFNYRYER